MATIPTQKYSSLPVAELPLLDIISAMGMALKSGTVNQWCQIFYSQELYVFSGSDPDNPPTPDKYPMVELFPLSDNAGRTIEEYKASIGLVCGIYDPALETLVYQDFELQQGIVRLEELFKQVLETVAAAISADSYIAEINSQRDDEVLHPFFVIGAEIKIITPL